MIEFSLFHEFFGKWWKKVYNSNCLSEPDETKIVLSVDNPAGLFNNSLIAYVLVKGCCYPRVCTSDDF